ncbi:MAG: twin-arginine translocase TatA/TatE family subunit [Actinobacteria bacterium HGW-Actinobacteria-1]|nr:MAG: twin-arginine translocase TatA/TatE family subunit [Actinobacteria bacterium HGW-Actinobacteria-1]
MGAFGMPGGWEIIAILAVVLLLFGPSQLPKLAKTFGKSAKALKDGMEGKLADDDDDEPKESVKAEKSDKGDE